MGKLEQVMRKINKKSADEIIQQGLEYSKIDKIPFPSPRLNYILYGGLPVARITELSGKENSGKTTTALGFCGKAQEKYPDRKVVYVDVENTLDEQWARTLGVDTDELILMRPYKESAEDIFEYLYDIIETGEVSLVVLDSVPALTPDNQLNENIKKSTYCGVAGPMAKFTRDVLKKIEPNNTGFIFINQLRDDIDNPWSNHRTPGGRALKHYASLRLFTKKGKYLDDNYNEKSRSYNNPSGHNVEIQIVKTKVCKPNRPYGTYTLDFTKGIAVIYDTIEVAIKYNIIADNTPWYPVINPDTGEIIEKDDEKLQFQGKAKLKAGLEKYPDVLKYVREKVYEKLMAE